MPSQTIARICRPWIRWLSAAEMTGPDCKSGASHHADMNPPSTTRRGPTRRVANCARQRHRWRIEIT
ncbi:hypothetical protein BN931_159 [Bifidobacterium animalis subsp. lactis CECT 8145]|nr:hypothetical protein BN931_159 [Bifidobacterium animalis subsp. lactis CECT 8145]